MATSQLFAVDSHSNHRRWRMCWARAHWRGNFAVIGNERYWKGVEQERPVVRMVLHTLSIRKNLKILLVRMTRQRLISTMWHGM